MSRRYPVLQVDAFTDRPLGGNPCAVVFDAGDLEPETMQAVAREMNLSETVFVVGDRPGGVVARYFTPTEEIPMAGHPTLATAAALVDRGRVDPAATSELTIELRVAPIRVDLEHEGGKLTEITMTQLAATFGRRYRAEEVGAAFGLDAHDIDARSPIEIVSTGTPQLIVPVANLDALRRARRDDDRLESLRHEGGFFSAHLFCQPGLGDGARTFARHFAVGFEDPFTGSGTGGMGAHLWHHGRIDSPRFVAEQGHWMGRPGRGQVEVLGPRDAIEGVRVGGRATVVLRGELQL